MRILVTGGRGAIGTALVAELRSRGHIVIASDLQHAEDPAGFSLGTDAGEASYLRCDVGEYRQLARLFEEAGPFDLIYHCAAEFGRWNGEDFYEQLWRTNAVGTKHLVRLQEREGFRLVHFSSSEVYGDWPEIMVESVPAEHPIAQMNDYAMTKWVNEMQIHNSAVQFGTESVIVRLFNTYGPGEHYTPYRSVNCRFLYHALHGLPWTVHRGHLRTSSYVEDTVRTLANVCTSFRPGETYNIASDELHSVEELSDIVVEVTGADPSLARYAEPELLTTRAKQVDTSKAAADLDHRPVWKLRDGMQATAEWMRRTYT
jgi:dTDP-glucose 4,6-dehydratase